MGILIKAESAEEGCDVMEFANARVRLLRVEINNFMNVEHGVINFATNLASDIWVDKSDILGIYGQNGSGKTAFVNVLEILDCLLTGISLPEGSENYITMGKAQTSCIFEFSVSDTVSFYRIFYSFTIDKRNNKIENGDKSSAFISTEQIQYKEFSNSKWSVKKTLIKTHISVDEPVVIKPEKNRLIALGSSEQIIARLNALAILAVEKSQSYLFSNEVLKLMFANYKNNNCSFYTNILVILKEYASYNLYIIKNSDMGLINLNIMLPLSMKTETHGMPLITQSMLRLDTPGTIPKQNFTLVCDCIHNINMVLGVLIPGMQLELRQIGSELSKDNKELVTAELQSIRCGQRIPLKYESDGIKKIISILSALIAVHNFQSITVVIDEFDSGIFEYLLGEILTVLERSGRGQLIFTSHNLRPLEVLNKNNVIFTTTNKANRYLRLKNVKRNNNLRDLYYRSIILSGQDEEIYDQTNDIFIEKAFRAVEERHEEN